MNDNAGWLPDDFEHPMLVSLPTGEHMRPIRERDVEMDYAAVMGSRDRLWTIFGESWGWPLATMSFEHDQRDLARHERETIAHESFCYAILDAAESRLLGCVYIDPPDRDGCDAVVAWWVVDDHVDTPLGETIAGFIKRWLADTWPLPRPWFDPLCEQ